MVVTYFRTVILKMLDKKVLRMKTKSWVRRSNGKLKKIKDDLLALLNYQGDQIIKDRIAKSCRETNLEDMIVDMKGLWKLILRKQVRRANSGFICLSI
jgi:hypothetical protein